MTRLLTRLYENERCHMQFVSLMHRQWGTEVLSGLSTQVLERIKDPMQTLVSRDHFETAYAVLAHFLLIAQRAPCLFSQVRMQPPCIEKLQ
jgi:hypothetical protein